MITAKEVRKLAEEVSQKDGKKLIENTIVTLEDRICTSAREGKFFVDVKLSERAMKAVKSSLNAIGFEICSKVDFTQDIDDQGIVRISW